MALCRTIKKCTTEIGRGERMFEKKEKKKECVLNSRQWRTKILESPELTRPSARSETIKNILFPTHIKYRDQEDN